MTRHANSISACLWLAVCALVAGLAYSQQPTSISGLVLAGAAAVPAVLTLLVLTAGKTWPSGRKAAFATLPWVVLCASLVAISGGIASPAIALVLIAPLSALLTGWRSRTLEASLFSLIGLAGGILIARFASDLPVSAGLASLTGVLALGAIALSAFMGFAVLQRTRARSATGQGKPEPDLPTQEAAEPDPASDDGVMIVDVTSEGEVRSVSGTVDAKLKPVPGKPLTDAFPSDCHDAVKACLTDGHPVARVRAGGKLIEITCDPHKDGNRIFLSLASADEDVAQAGDIIATDAERRAEVAESALTQRTTFFAGLGHELKTPLNAILGFSDLMRNELRGELPDAYKEYVQLIHESGQDLLLIVEDILDYAKAEAGHTRLELEPVDLVASCESVIAQLSAFAERSGVMIRQKATDEVWAIADARAVRQIWQNLLSNAIKYSSSGGMVSVDARSGKSTVALSVRDTGAGMTERDLERIAQPFQQGTNSRGRAGTGLGLAVVKSFADQMQGKVIIDTAPGEGTRVRVILPKAVDEDVVGVDETAAIEETADVL